MSSILIVIPILVILMFSLGLELNKSDFASVRLRDLVVGLTAQLVLLPLLAFGSVSILSLPPIYAAGFMLIACCPGGSSSNVFTMLIKGNVALSVALTACTSLITLVTLPLIMGLFLAGSHAVDLPFGKLVVQNILLVAVPLLGGMVLKFYYKEPAIRIGGFIKRYALLLLLLLVLIFFIENRAILIDNLPELGGAITLLILCALCLGVMLSRLFGLGEAERRTIAIEVGMQNAAQAIAIASSPFVFNSVEMAVPAVVYALLMNVVLVGYVRWKLRVC